MCHLSGATLSCSRFHRLRVGLCFTPSSSILTPWGSILSDKPQSLTHTHTHTRTCTPVHTHTHFYGRRDMSLSLTQTIRDLTCAPEFISTAFVFSPWVGKIWRRKWQPTPVFLPGKSHGRRKLVGYRFHGIAESDMTERLHFLCVLVMCH